MTISDLRIAQANRPFLPYEFRTESGHRYRVKHPETLSIDADMGLAILTRGMKGLAILKISSITAIIYPVPPVTDEVVGPDDGEDQ